VEAEELRTSVRVGHATVVVRAPDPGAIAPAVQRALTAALEEVGARWPIEWLFVRRVDIELRARVGGAAVDTADITRAIVSVLSRRIEQMRATIGNAAHGVEGVVGDDVAWFPSEGAARGALLRDLLAGRRLEWPCSVMAWARTLDDVARWPTRALGDALAHGIGHAPATFPIPETAARAWLRRWTEGEVTFDIRALPADVRARIRAAALRGDGDAAGRLRALAHLFAAWPPARDATVDAGALADLAARAEEMPAPPATPSRAGGLVAWAILFQRSRLDTALWSDLGDERLVRAGRWAIARALEAADLGDGDPLLRLWAGERTDGPPLARWVFDGLDPERLHRGALRFANDRGWLAGELVLAPLGDGVVLMAGDLCVDHLPGSTEDALPAAVRRFVARLGRAPAGVTVEERLAPELVDAFADVDVMALPDRWRAAVRAAGSMARRVAWAEWRVGLRELRGWLARIRAGTPATVELPRARAARLPLDLDGARVALATTEVAVALT